MNYSGTTIRIQALEVEADLGHCYAVLQSSANQNKSPELELIFFFSTLYQRSTNKHINNPSGLRLQCKLNGCVLHDVAAYLLDILGYRQRGSKGSVVPGSRDRGVPRTGSTIHYRHWLTAGKPFQKTLSRARTKLSAALPGNEGLLHLARIKNIMISSPPIMEPFLRECWFTPVVGNLVLKGRFIQPSI